MENQQQPTTLRDKYVDRKGKLFKIITCFGDENNRIYGVSVNIIKTGRRISIIPDSLSKDVDEINQKFLGYAKHNHWLRLSKEHYANIKKMWRKHREHNKRHRNAENGAKK